MDANFNFLNTMVSDKIKDEISKQVEVRKSRTNRDESGDDLMTSSMIEVVLINVFSKWNREVVDMMENNQKEAKE